MPSIMRISCRGSIRAADVWRRDCRDGEMALAEMAKCASNGKPNVGKNRLHRLEMSDRDIMRGDSMALSEMRRQCRRLLT